MDSITATRLVRAGALSLLLLLLSTIAVADDLIPLVNWSVPPWPSASAATTTTAPRHGHFVAATTGDINSAGATFVAVTPCRLVDTRNANGAFGGPAFVTDETRTYSFPANPTCTGIPATVFAYSLNFTVVNYTGRGNLRAFPAGSPLPNVSTVNFGSGLPVANAAIVAADSTGAIAVNVTGPTNVVIDINGYFTGARRKLMTAGVAGTYSANLFAVSVPAGDATAGKVPFTIHATNATFNSIFYGSCLFAAIPTGVGAAPSTESLTLGTSMTVTCQPGTFNVPGVGAMVPGLSVFVQGLAFTPTAIDIQFDVVNQPGSRVYLVP